MKTNIRPLGDVLVVAVDEAKTETEGGIIIPGNANISDAPIRGTVLAVGPGVTDSKGVTTPLEVKVNDVVTFPKNAGQESNEKNNVFLHEAEIIAVLR